MIKSILEDVASYNDTAMVLANALPFEMSPNKLSDSSEGAHCLHYCGSLEGSKVLKMPYNAKLKSDQDERRFSMYIFVPSDENSLPKFIGEMKMDATTVKNILRKLKKRQERWNNKISEIYFQDSIWKARFHSPIMEELGLTLPFRAGQTELMSFIDSPLSELLYATDITPKSRIETDERGITRAVVTYATLCGPARQSQALPSKLKIVADNHFFLITEDCSGSIISASTMLSTPLTTG